MKNQLTFLIYRTTVGKYSTAADILSKSSCVCDHHLRRMKTAKIIISALLLVALMRDAPRALLTRRRSAVRHGKCSSDVKLELGCILF